MADTDSKVRIYSGEVETSSAAAFGLAMVRRGNGARVAVVRFLRPETSGEAESAVKLGIEVYPSDLRVDGRSSAQKGWRTALDLIVARGHDLVVLDGLLDAMEAGFIPLADVETLFEVGFPVELVLTGRKAPVELVKRADTVVEMLDIKH
ncbi:MAG: cob(I)yrinic acid a,c-diamide adenosyltransferase [bacterium]|nr:cob(I)yrinic acid a,c-diamide adenosyltransferase [bacterium]